MDLKIKVYSGIKYHKESVKVAETEYRNVKHMEVKKMTDEEIRNEGFDEFDEYGKYMTAEK